jgi:hypothetical protein
MMETNLIEDLRRLSPPGVSWWIGLALVAGVTAAAWRLLRRPKGRAGPGAANPPAADVWGETLRELERLLPLLRPDRSRAYGMASTALLRRYLEHRYAIHAPLLATEEFLAAARQSPALPTSHRQTLGEYLRLCDLLKFGRAVAETAELHQLHSAAVEFVTVSRPPDPAPTSAITTQAGGRTP